MPRERQDRIGGDSDGTSVSEGLAEGVVAEGAFLSRSASYPVLESFRRDS